MLTNHVVGVAEHNSCHVHNAVRGECCVTTTQSYYRKTIEGLSVL